jgi:hypothetical protein
LWFLIFVVSYFHLYLWVKFSLQGGERHLRLLYLIARGPHPRGNFPFFHITPGITGNMRLDPAFAVRFPYFIPYLPVFYGHPVVNSGHRHLLFERQTFLKIQPF